LETRGKVSQMVLREAMRCASRQVRRVDSTVVPRKEVLAGVRSKGVSGSQPFASKKGVLSREAWWEVINDRGLQRLIRWVIAEFTRLQIAMGQEEFGLGREL
jgi:hypothetical protein